MVTQYRRYGVAALVVGLVVGVVGELPTLAQQARFESFTLSGASPTASVSGSTNGIFALSNLAGRDRNGTVCAGFADNTPDHIMVLQQDFAALTLQVNSGGNDTSLLIQGPNDGTVRCGEDTDRRNPDAMVQDQGWSAGTYRIWVGSHIAYLHSFGTQLHQLRHPLSRRGKNSIDGQVKFIMRSVDRS